MPAIGKRGVAEGFMSFQGGGGPCRRAPLMWRHHRHQSDLRRSLCPGQDDKKLLPLGQIKRLPLHI